MLGSYWVIFGVRVGVMFRVMWAVRLESFGDNIGHDVITHGRSLATIWPITGETWPQFGHSWAKIGHDLATRGEVWASKNDPPSTTQVPKLAMNQKRLGHYPAKIWPRSGHELASTRPKSGHELATSCPLSDLDLATNWPLVARYPAQIWPLVGRYCQVLASKSGPPLAT